MHFELNNSNNGDTSNNKLVSVKLDFFGELRRFSTLGTSFRTLVDEITSVLNLGKDKQIVIKYRDEEGDLITMSTDMELRSALSGSGSLLRLQVSYPKGDVVMGNADEEKKEERSVPAFLYPEVQQPPPAFYPQGAFFPQQPGFVPPVQPVDAEGQPITTPFFGPFGGRGGRGGRGFGGRGGRGFGWGGPGYHGHGRGHHHHQSCQWDGSAPWMASGDGLVDQILQMGFDVKREKVYRMLKKYDGDVERVTKKLLWKKEKKDRRDAKKEKV